MALQSCCSIIYHQHPHSPIKNGTHKSCQNGARHREDCQDDKRVADVIRSSVTLAYQVWRKEGLEGGFAAEADEAVKKRQDNCRTLK